MGSTTDELSLERRHGADPGQRTSQKSLAAVRARDPTLEGTEAQAHRTSLEFHALTIWRSKFLEADVDDAASICTLEFAYDSAASRDDDVPFPLVVSLDDSYNRGLNCGTYCGL